MAIAQAHGLALEPASPFASRPGQDGLPQLPPTGQWHRVHPDGRTERIDQDGYLTPTGQIRPTAATTQRSR